MDSAGASFELGTVLGGIGFCLGKDGLGSGAWGLGAGTGLLGSVGTGAGFGLVSVTLGTGLGLAAASGATSALHARALEKRKRLQKNLMPYSVRAPSRVQSQLLKPAKRFFLGRLGRCLRNDCFWFRFGRSLWLRRRIVQADLASLPDRVGDQFTRHRHFHETEQVFGQAGPSLVLG